MPNPLISHIEIPTTDLNRSSEFYKNVFSWDFKPFGNGYLLYNNHQGILAGLRKVDSVAKGNTTVFHVTVENLEQMLEKTKSAGGHIIVGKTTIPAMGWYAVISDLDGNSVGLYQKS
jgi:predicted enzyme related to lactoylglutathione lyase